MSSHETCTLAPFILNVPKSKKKKKLLLNYLWNNRYKMKNVAMMHQNILNVDSQYVDTKVVNISIFHHYMSIKNFIYFMSIDKLQTWSRLWKWWPIIINLHLSHFITIVYISLKLALLIHICFIVLNHLLNLHHKASSFFYVWC